MAGTQLRLMGTTATYAPVIKRGVATLSDGRTVTLAIDTNLATGGGTDVTGVAKIQLYVSNDASRTTFTPAAPLTPAVAPASATRAARASLAVGADNSIWVAWQGVDNGLYVSRWTYSAGTVTFVTTETVQAAGAITDRFRAIDMDVAGNATVAIATYEANAATGNAAWHRVYVRSNAATWVRAVSIAALLTNQFIRNNSEDVSIAWRGDGVVSNVGRFLFYGTKTYTTGDLGDLLREYSFNVSTAPADGGVVLGTWSFSYNQNQAAGSRRAMIFTLSSSLYLWAGVVGSGVPKFLAIKLTSGNYGTPTTVNTAGFVSTIALANYFKIDPSSNPRTYWSASYKDNRLLFGFVGLGTGSAPRIIREVSMAWPSVGEVNAKPTIDLVPRPTDSAYYINGGPIAIYGGDNERTQAGLKTYNWTAIYGQPSTNLSSTSPRVFRFISEDTFDAPFIVGPTAIEPTSRPIYRVRVDNVNLQPNLYGKIEIAVASNSTFTTSVKSIVEPDKNLRYFGSKDGLSGGVTQVAVPTPGPTQALTQGVWYWRARIVSDKDTPGAWSATQSFTVSHPPTANPISPTPASVIADAAPGNQYSFAWTRSDTEPGDTQTAFRLVVRRLDTLASVLDTGFVSSSVASTTQTIDANALGIVEVPLDWTVQLRDADGVAGQASSPIQFVIGDPPNLSIIAPTPGVAVSTALPTITWNFTGFGMRQQRAYRVSIYDNTTPNQLTNASFESGTMTGWTQNDGTVAVSTVQTHSGTFAAFITPNGTGPTPRVGGAGTNLRPVVVGQSYTAEAWIRPTTANKPVFVAINWYDATSTYLSTSSIATPAIPGVWQNLKLTGIEAPAGASFGTVQAGVDLTPAVGDTAYVDDLSFHDAGTFNDDPIVTTGWRVGTTNSYTFTSQVLVDQAAYRIVLEVQDDGGLVTVQDVAVTTDWVEPALASAATVTVIDNFKVRVSWTSAGQDSDFVSYRIYRRYMKTAIPEFDVTNSATTWYLLYETSDQLTNYAFDDYLVPLNRQVEYVVVQLADRFGSLIESNITTTMPVTLAGDRYFFVPEVPFGGIASFEAAGVTGDNFTRDVEQEALQVIDRGRQMQVGDDLGYSGTMTIQLRNPATARRDREFFELVSAQYNKVYVKTPFGDVVLIALGNVNTTRQAGYGGHADFADLSVPYMQIIDEALVERQVG